MSKRGGPVTYKSSPSCRRGIGSRTKSVIPRGLPNIILDEPAKEKGLAFCKSRRCLQRDYVDRPSNMLRVKVPKPGVKTRRCPDCSGTLVYPMREK